MSKENLCCGDCDYHKIVASGLGYCTGFSREHKIYGLAQGTIQKKSPACPIFKERSQDFEQKIANVAEAK